jgi:hypothetical protein
VIFQSRGFGLGGFARHRADILTTKIQRHEEKLYGFLFNFTGAFSKAAVLIQESNRLTCSGPN